MKIIRGSDRIVLTLPSFGIVIKFAKIRLKDIVIDIILYLKDRRTWKTMLKFFKYHHCQVGGFKYYLFNGIISNKLEYKLWRKTKHQILVPTIFSFFGLFNIQKFVQVPKDKTDADFWCQFNMIVRKKWLWHDSHAFSNFENFTIETGKVQFIDYGSKAVIGVVLQFGDLIYEKFDVTYIRKDRKQNPPST